MLASSLVFFGIFCALANGQLFPIFGNQARPPPPNTLCRGDSDGRQGTCTTSNDCLTKGGMPDGQCPPSASLVCCIRKYNYLYYLPSNIKKSQLKLTLNDFKECLDSV
ncbi:hypothetical protein CHUAL_004204 [Chamberlinius hualienensis]